MFFDTFDEYDIDPETFRVVFTLCSLPEDFQKFYDEENNIFDDDGWREVVRNALDDLERQSSIEEIELVDQNYYKQHCEDYEFWVTLPDLYDLYFFINKKEVNGRIELNGGTMPLFAEDFYVDLDGRHKIPYEDWDDFFSQPW